MFVTCLQIHLAALVSITAVFFCCIGRSSADLVCVQQCDTLILRCASERLFELREAHVCEANVFMEPFYHHGHRVRTIQSTKDYTGDMPHLLAWAPFDISVAPADEREEGLWKLEEMRISSQFVSSIVLGRGHTSLVWYFWAQHIEIGCSQGWAHSTHSLNSFEGGLRKGLDWQLHLEWEGGEESFLRETDSEIEQRDSERGGLRDASLKQQTGPTVEKEKERETIFK